MLEEQVYKDEMLALAEEVEEGIEEEWSIHASRILGKYRLGWGHPKLPICAWRGIAQAVADASGFRIVIRVEEFEECEEAGTFRVVGSRKIAELEPWIFAETNPL